MPRGSSASSSSTPAAYALKAELEGFSTVERPDLTIKLGGKVNIEVTLTGAVKDVITVTGESPLLDERKIDQGTNISTVALDKVPTARDPWSLLSQAPGVLVDRVNVGGNESGQQSNFIGVGSNGRDNTFTVDGVVLTDMNAVGARPPTSTSGPSRRCSSRSRAPTSPSRPRA